ncbi:MAG: endolytic transglycosylase MltG [Candidatus Dormibacteria bacterium]
MSSGLSRSNGPRGGGGLRTFFGVVGVFLLLVLLVVGGGAAYYNNELHSVHRTGGPAISLTIPPGTSTSGVADLLASKGLIGNSLVFALYARLHGLSLEAGQYSIPGGSSMTDIAQLLAHNQSGGTTVTVTIPEGYTARQIGGLMARKGLFSQDAFMATTMQPHPEDFLAGHDPGLGLDGYLFPDTYQFSPKATAGDVVTILLRHFGEKVTPDLRARAQAHNVSFAQAVVLASIVEREARFDNDRPMIAQVFYNRIKAGIPLQADATLLYARGATGGEVSEDDKKINSPYNTYLHTGVPPGAISNPGLAAIQAALDPTPNDYIYYVTDRDGHAHYSRTLAQHQQCQINFACPTAK